MTSMHRTLLTLLVLWALGLAADASAQAGDAGTMSIWAAKNYSWDNPLHSEVAVNGTTINIFTDEAMEPIAEQLKEGWNKITVETTAQEPANQDNHLIFRIGPTHKESDKVIMQPVLWEFRNGTDWKFENGTYSHPLGPGVKKVMLEYSLYYAGMTHEQGELKAGDFVLQGKPEYSSWSSPVIGTVFINGTPLNSFLLAERQIIITPFLKPGKNEIKLVSGRVKNAIANNDIRFSILGPAEWMVSENQFLVKPITKFNSIQGWTRDPKSGQLMNKAKPDSETIERVIPFMLKTPPGVTNQ
jgi:hypothetical protein